MLVIVVIFINFVVEVFLMVVVRHIQFPV